MPVDISKATEAPLVQKYTMPITVQQPSNLTRKLQFLIDHDYQFEQRAATAEDEVMAATLATTHDESVSVATELRRREAKCN